VTWHCVWVRVSRLGLSLEIAINVVLSNAATADFETGVLVVLLLAIPLNPDDILHLRRTDILLQFPLPHSGDPLLLAGFFVSEGCLGMKGQVLNTNVAQKLYFSLTIVMVSSSVQSSTQWC